MDYKKSTDRKKTDKKPKLNPEACRKASYFLASVLCVITLTVMFGMSFDFASRPSYSEDEKRELASFPEFTFKALFSGDYFEDINLWFADTFPNRDKLVDASTDIKTTIGVGQSIHNFSEGSGDVIPDAEVESQAVADVQAGNANQGVANDLLKPASPPGTMTGNGQSDNGVEQALSSIYIYGNTAYEYYNFNQTAADNYISAINAAANEAQQYGMTLYNMVVPTSMDITLNENSRSKLNSSDQKEAINYIYSGMNSNVNTVQIFDLLKAHKDEYLYFRTDHHWTNLGAYYAYAQLMTVMNKQYVPLSDFTQYEFPGFLGSFYSDSGKSPALGNTPDTVYAFMPKGDISFQIKEKGASDFIDWPLICDAENYATSTKYLCFIGGDQPISIIQNNSAGNEDSCVFIKESFGNAFAPYLASHYKYVYIIDYRHFDQDILSFAASKGCKDVIIQNNTSMTRNASLVNKLSAML